MVKLDRVKERVSLAFRFFLNNNFNHFRNSYLVFLLYIYIYTFKLRVVRVLSSTLSSIWEALAKVKTSVVVKLESCGHERKNIDISNSVGLFRIVQTPLPPRGSDRGGRRKVSSNNKA